MKVLHIFPLLLLLLNAAAQTDDLEKGQNMKHTSAAVTCLRVPDDYLTHRCPPENGETLVFDMAKQLTAAGAWCGETDFSLHFTFGWNGQGLCFFFDVKDSDVVNEKEKNVDLWMQDSVELFLAAPKGRQFGNDMLAFERLQLILSPPDPAGKIRSFTLYDSAYGPDIPFRASGERTDDGYRIRLLIPHHAFGNYDLPREKLFRMQISCNDYDRRDGDVLPPRKVTLGHAVQPSASAEDYPLFRLCRDQADNPNPSLATRWSPQLPRLSEGDTLRIRPELPEFLDRAHLSIQDLSGQEVQRIEIFPTTEVLEVKHISKLDSVGLRFLFTGYAGGHARGTVERSGVQIAGLLRKIGAVRWSELSPWRAAEYLKLISAIEFLRLAATPGSLNSNRLADATDECEARLAILEDRPLPSDLPEKYRCLELQRNFSAQLNIAFSRGGRPNERIFSAISLPWGNLPCINAERYSCDSVTEAEKLIEELTAYCTAFPAPEIAGAERVYAGRGHLLSDGLRSDMEPARLLSFYASSRPRHVFRMTPEEAFHHPVDAVIVMPDAPESMKKQLLDFASKRGLPLIPFAEKNRFRHSLIAGTPDYPEIAWFWHSRNGVPNDFLIVRRGTEVIRCGFDNRELGKCFIEFILAGKPLTRETAAHFAQLRGAAMPQPRPEDTVAASKLRTGDVHTHTIFSDGQSTPAGLLAEAPAAGLDFLVISDHDEVTGALRLQQNLRQSRCGLWVFAGQEITMTPRYHLNVYPISHRIDDRFSWKSIRKQADVAGAVVQLNHPMTYGTGFSELWYGDISRAGLDAIERRTEYLEKWRRTADGKVPAVTGSTDTHQGIFGYYSATVVLTDNFSSEALAEAIRAGRAAMIDPFLPELACGDPVICRAVTAALLDPASPERFASRLKAALKNFDAIGLIRNSETIPAPYPPTSPRPQESFNLEERNNMKLR